MPDVEGWIMNWDDENPMFNIEPGCPVHGDQWMKPCRLCGVEFCGRCFPDSQVCGECGVIEDADEAVDDDEVGG